MQILIFKSLQTVAEHMFGTTCSPKLKFPNDYITFIGGSENKFAYILLEQRKRASMRTFHVFV